MFIIRAIIWMNFLQGQGPEAEGQWGHGGGTQVLGLLSSLILGYHLGAAQFGFLLLQRKKSEKKKPQTARGQADNAFIYRFSAIFSHFHSAATLIPAQSIKLY